MKRRIMTHHCIFLVISIAPWPCIRPLRRRRFDFVTPKRQKSQNLMHKLLQTHHTETITTKIKKVQIRTQAALVICDLKFYANAIEILASLRKVLSNLLTLLSRFKRTYFLGSHLSHITRS